jgi:membrane-bound ClpP family serine protease
MKRFQPNLEPRGRLVRAIIGVILLAAGLTFWSINLTAAALFIFASAFVLFEAARGWCALRACGVRTRI